MSYNKSICQKKEKQQYIAVGAVRLEPSDQEPPITITRLTRSACTTEIARISRYTVLSTVLKCQDVQHTISVKEGLSLYILSREINPCSDGHRPPRPPGTPSGGSPCVRPAPPHPELRGGGGGGASGPRPGTGGGAGGRPGAGAPGPGVRPSAAQRAEDPQAHPEVPAPLLLCPGPEADGGGARAERPANGGSSPGHAHLGEDGGSGRSTSCCHGNTGYNVNLVHCALGFFHQ